MKEQYSLIVVIADIYRRKIYVSKKVIKDIHKLAHGSAMLYNSYRNKYPDFEVVII